MSDERYAEEAKVSARSGGMVGGRAQVFEALRKNGALSRAEVARLTGLSRAAVSNVVKEFVDSGLVVESLQGRDSAGSVGRPGVMVMLNPRAGAALGVDVGHRYLRVVVADLAHRVVAEEVLELAEEHDAQEALATVSQTVEASLERSGVERRKVVGVGMALAGPVGIRTREVYPSSVSPSWVGSRPAETLSKSLGLPVLLENGANLEALAELAWGAAKGLRDVLHVAVSDGIGAGLILDGRLYRGALGTAGEIGHVTVMKDGPMCRCGKRGCLEALAASPALLELLRPVLGEGLTIEQAIQLAGEGDQACRRAIGDAGNLVGLAAAHACNLLNPERLVVGGQLAEAGDVFLDQLRESLRRDALHVATDVEVVAGQLGRRARALGGVALALRETDSFVSPADPSSEAEPSEDVEHGA